MVWHESFTKVSGIIAGGCTICGIIGGAAVTLANYKTKIDSLEQLEARIAKLETRLTSASGTGAQGADGPRGPQGAPGRPGDQGATGERGPKGEPGLTPAQVSDIERRITNLEGRSGSLVPSSISPLYGGPSPSTATIEAPSNAMPRNASGCFYVPPETQAVVGNLGANDKVCGLDGQIGMSIIRVDDDRFWFTSQYGQRDCQISSNRCFPPFNNQMRMKARRVVMDGQGQVKMEIEFSKRDR